MNSEVKKYTSEIKNFRKVLSDYYKCFNEYYYANNQKNHVYSISHSELVENSLKLQVYYIKLPKELQNRLIEVDIEVLLQCNNSVDLYSFREFIVTNKKFYTIATIVERTDAELRLALEVDKEGVWDNYSMLPRINLNFYRKEKYKSLLNETVEIENENLNEREVEEDSIELSNSQWNDRINEINDKPAQKMMDGFTEFLGKGNNVIDKSTEAIEKSSKLIDALSPVIKVTLDFIKNTFS